MTIYPFPLSSLNIVGAVSIYQEGEICHWGIETLLKYCDKVVICQDNPDDKTKIIVASYQNKYPDKIVVGESGLPPVKKIEGLRDRHRNYYGEIAQACLNLVKKEHDKEPIDLLIKMDSDEMLTDNFPKALLQFFNSSADTLLICPMGVYDDFHIIIDRDLISHARVYKYLPDICAIPYSQQDYYLPYRKGHKIIKLSWNYVHMARFTAENREWRKRISGQIIDPESKLRRVDKPAYEITPEEYMEKIYKNSNFIRYKDYHGDINEIPFINL